ncbi:hypothetical protein MKEN_00708900 [Mycena kentingensis (nom. inval.)]|nr:hypothetical protein MKEN_00708900 [Mycena kentingensis (nom. inval.)]
MPAVASYNGIPNPFLTPDDPLDDDEEQEQFGTLFCRALYDYTAQTETALSFRRDAIIEVLSQEDSGWWDGLLGDDRGWFPSNYVEVIELEPEVQHKNTLDNASVLSMSHAMAAQLDSEDPDWLNTGLGVLQERESRNATTAPEPEEPDDFWMPEVTPDGQIFYVNGNNGAQARQLPSSSQRDPTTPPIPVVVAPVTPSRLTRSRSGSAAGLNGVGGPLHGPRGMRNTMATPNFGVPRRTTTPEPWVKRLADDGASYYYYNPADGTSQWQRPDPLPEPSNRSIMSAMARPLPPIAPSASLSIRPLPTISNTPPPPPQPSLNAEASAVHSPVDLALELTSAERIALSLQQSLAPPFPDLISDLAAVAASAIQSVIESIDDVTFGRRPPGHENLLDQLVAGIVFAVRDLLYIAGASSGPIPPGVLPKPLRRAYANKGISPLKPTQRKVTATLSRLVLSSRALEYDAGSNVSDTLDRVRSDAEELERTLEAFLLEVQQQREGDPQRPLKRLRGVFETTNLGLGLLGGGAAASWKGFGWVLLPDEEAARDILSPNSIDDLGVHADELDAYFFSLEDAVEDRDEISIEAIHSRAQMLIAQLSSFLRFASAMNVAQHVDVDGARPDSPTRPSELYLQTVNTARTLIRRLEHTMQALYDGSASILLIAQSLRQFEPNQAQNSSLDSLLVLLAALRGKIGLVRQTFEALLSIGYEQADISTNDYKHSIHWRMSRLSEIDSAFGGASRPMSTFSGANGDIVDFETAFGRFPPRRHGPGMSISMGAGQHAYSGRISPTPIEEVEDIIVPDSPSLNAGSLAPALIRDLEDDDDEEQLIPSRRPRRPSVSSKVIALLGPEAARSSQPLLSVIRPEPIPKPWYLQPSYNPQEITIDADGFVRAGTVPALVERLTAHEQADTTFIKAFLMTFKSFTSVDELFELLEQRFWVQPPPKLTIAERDEWGKLKQHIIQARVLNIFKSMIVDDDVLEKDDMHILDRIKEFTTTEDVVKVPAAKQLPILIERAQKGGESTRIVTTPGPPPPPLIPKMNRPLKLLDIESLELARQMCVMESQLYQRVRPMECLQRARESRGENLDNITVVIQTNNKIALWLQESILSKEDLRRRVSVVKFWISVADRCRMFNNFSTMAAITAGLNTPPIRRLKKTWGEISQRHMQQFNACETIIDSNKNFNNYRTMMTSIESPCVPFMGVYLTDLQFIHDGNRDNVPGPPPPGAEEGATGMPLVNFRKRQMASEVINDIKRWQLPYNFQPVPSIQTFIQESLASITDSKETSERLWEMSLQRSPRTTDFGSLRLR